MIRQLSEKSETEYAVSSIGGYYLENLWKNCFHHFSEDGKYLLYRPYLYSYALLTRLDDLSVADTLDTNKSMVTNSAFIPGTDLFITGSTDDTIRIWQTGKTATHIIRKFPGNGFIVSPDGKKLLVVNNVRLSLYNMSVYRLLFQAVAVNDRDYFIQIPGNPYYAASKNAVKELTFRFHDKYFSFDQFDLSLNRPDLVLKAIGSNDTALISAYRNAYNKRIKRSGFKAVSFSSDLHLPEIMIKGPEPYGETNQLELTISFTASDSKYLLDRYSITQNEVPLEGVNGFDLKKNKTHQYSGTVQVPLLDGKNVIRVSCLNEMGVESLAPTFFVTYHPTVTENKPRLFFFGIGINQFADSSYNLKWSVKDIRDLAVFFKTKYGDRCRIDTLINRSITTATIRALREKLLQTGINDKVIIAYSGHGLLSRSYDYYLSTYAVNFERPEQNGLPYEELETLLDNIPARKRLLLIDACHSGEIDKDDIKEYERVQAQLDNNHKGVIILHKNTQRLGTLNSFELMQELFVKVGKNTGAVIISASSGTQFALERGDLENGVFTFSILEAMEKFGSMKVSDLKNYVSRRVVELTNGLQQPTSRNETILTDWDAW